MDRVGYGQEFRSGQGTRANIPEQANICAPQIGKYLADKPPNRPAYDTPKKYIFPTALTFMTSQQTIFRLGRKSARNCRLDKHRLKSRIVP